MFKSTVKNILISVAKTALEVALVLSLISLVDSFGILYTMLYMSGALLLAMVILLLGAWRNYRKLIKEFSETLNVDKEKARDVIEKTFEKGTGK